VGQIPALRLKKFAYELVGRRRDQNNFRERAGASKRKRKACPQLIPLNLDGYMFTDQWDLGVLANEVRSRVAADFRNWENPSSNFSEHVDRVIKALRADEGAREKPPPSRL
jgi:hypothetical protein